MYKNRLFLGIAVVSLLLMSLAVFHPFTGSFRVSSRGASDFYQRHPDWIWTVNPQNAGIPVTGNGAFPDYFQRHPELSVSPILGLGASDYFQRHPDLTLSAETSVDLTDYFFRHPASQPSLRNIDLTDYYFRHS